MSPESPFTDNDSVPFDPVEEKDILF